VSFGKLEKVWNKYLYDGDNGSGIAIPFNVGPVREGKVTVLCTGSTKEEVDKLFINLKESMQKI
jgi:hypothetical protein